LGLIVLLLTHSQYEDEFVAYFPSLDNHLLSTNVHILVHTLEEPTFPQALSLRRGVQSGNYTYFASPLNNTVIHLRQPLVLPPHVPSFEASRTMHPRTYCHRGHNLSYSVANRYYTYQMLRLSILDGYEFFLKIDSDIYACTSLDVTAQIFASRSVFMHTAAFRDNPSCDATAFTTANAFCPTGILDGPLRDPHKVYFGNFLAGWLGLFASKEILHFSEHFWRAGWEYRWTDQTFWRYALLVANATDRVLDQTAWRSSRKFLHKSGTVCPGRSPSNLTMNLTSM